MELIKQLHPTNNVEIGAWARPNRELYFEHLTNR